VYLSRRDEEEGIGVNGVVLKVHRVIASLLEEPYYLIKGMHVWGIEQWVCVEQLGHVFYDQ